MTLGESGAKLIRLTTHADARGTLTGGEFGQELPFVPIRFFTVSNVPPAARRGEHAVSCDELLVAVAGSLSVGIHDGKRQYMCRLDRPDVALFLPRNTFSWQYEFSHEAILLVLASDAFATVKYISGLNEYLEAIN